MLTRESQYEDLKILYIQSGFMTDDEDNCGYEDYIFAVRKKWLFDYMKEVADHEITEEWLENWLKEEYTSDDAFQVYMSASVENEIVFDGPVFNDGPARRCMYVVRDELRSDGEYEDEVYLRTTNKDEALERFEKELAKVKKEVDDGEFFIDTEGELKTRISDGLPAFEVEDDDGDYYYLCVAREEFTDWRK